MMEIKRRHFLAALACTPLLLHVRPSQAGSESEILVSAGRNGNGDYELLGADIHGELLFRHALPARAHQVLMHPQKPWAIAVARRPGRSFEVYDIQARSPVRRVECQPGCFLYGHAQFSADGRTLITTEMHPDRQNGCLVFRDVENDFRVIRSLDSGGVGPHEFKLVEDAGYLVVANGGIRTEGREKLNIDTMQPSLAYIDYASGAVLQNHVLPAEFHQSSIRHIDIAPDGTLLVAMQFEGDPSRTAPLVAVHQPDKPMRVMDLPEEIYGRLKQYCGSACIDSSGRYGAISAPKGNRILFFDLAGRTYLGQVPVRDGCGLAKSGATGGFYASSGSGRLYLLDALTLEKSRLGDFRAEQLQWDNHLLSV
ncbi:MAG: DUF1513 domain-containing protein [Gammaproteobacteria bacterium]|nr:DUF1513 domain-containing protein [Gammaproteobacteria bacterium]